MKMCQGICTSQADDYCGMHMIDEECPACKHVWNAAHRENQSHSDTQWISYESRTNEATKDYLLGVDVNRREPIEEEEA